MKAQILVRPNELNFMEIQIPQPKEDEVLVKIKTACICNGSDPLLLSGEHLSTIPVVFGHESFGEIVQCGNAVKGFENGDRVSWWFNMGAFAEYVCISPNKVAMVKLPEFISDDESAMFELVAAASRAVEAVNIKKGDKILIIGLGPSGLIMSQIARNLGADKVIGWDLYPMRRNIGLELGCDEVFDSNNQDVVENTLNIVGEVDIVIDAFANDLLPDSPTFDNGIKVLRNGGTIISYGHPQNRRMFDPYYFQSKILTMRGPENDLAQIRDYYRKAVNYYKEGTLNLKPLITGRVPLEKVEEGIRLVVEHPDKYLKILVDI